MTEEFIMLSYLLRLYNTEPNNVFTEAGSKFRRWLFLSLFFLARVSLGHMCPAPIKTETDGTADHSEWKEPQSQHV